MPKIIGFGHYYEAPGALERQYGPYHRVGRGMRGFGVDAATPAPSANYWVDNNCDTLCDPSSDKFEGEANCDANCDQWRAVFQYVAPVTPAPPPPPAAAPCSEICNPLSSGGWMGQATCDQSCPDWRTTFGCPPGFVIDPGDPHNCVASAVTPAPPPPPKAKPGTAPPVVQPPAPKKMGVLGWSAVGAGALLLLAALSKKKGSYR